jgi:hypothetical protein
MLKPALSPARIASIALVLAVIFAVVVLAQPGNYHLRQWTEPVVVRPEITGVVYFYGAPASGVELRAAKVGSSNWPSCKSLPVVAVSNKMGAFRASALRKPSLLVNKSERIPVEVCLSRGKIQIDSWVSFLLPNERPVVQLKCEFPGPQTGQPEDHPCYTP